MIQPSSQKALIRRGILPLLPVMLLAAAVPLATASAQSSRQNYVQQLVNALPSGTDLATAPSAAFQAAVQKVILAHSPSQAAAIAKALADAVPVERAKEIADAIGRLFPTNPALRNQASDIGVALTTSIRARTSGSPTAATAGAREIGDTLSVLTYHVGLNDPANHDLIVSIIRAAIGVDPQPGVTPTIVSTLITNLANLGAPEALIDRTIAGINEVVDNPEIIAAIDDFLGNQRDKHLFPPGVQPGEILAHETPVVNG